MSLDNSLVSNFSKDHPDAFATVFNTYYPSLCSFAYRFLENVEDARDVVSEVFEKLWVKQTDLEAPGNIKSYLYVSVRNACINSLKRSHQQLERNKQLLQIISSDENYKAALLLHETTQQIYEEISLLPGQCKKIFELLYIEGLSSSEAARVLDLAEQTIRNQKTIGLNILKRKIFPDSVFTIAVIVSAAAIIIAVGMSFFLLGTAFTDF